MRHAKRIGQQRQRRRYRVRNALKGFATRPRLSVFRSHKNIYVQVVDDESGRTLASASTRDPELKGSYGGNAAAAVEVGKLIARRAAEAGVTKVVFDRREYKYHGRIAALADAARDAGLDLGAKPEPKPEAEKKPAKAAGKKEGGKGEKESKKKQPAKS